LGSESKWGDLEDERKKKVTEPNGKGGIGKLLLLVALLLGAFLAFRYSPLATLLTREGLLAAIESVRGSMWGPLVFMAAYAVATALALPGTIFTLAGGAVFGFGSGTLFNWIGANIGASMAFGLARLLGRDGLERILGGRAGALDRVTENHGFRTLLTLRLIPVAPFNALNFAGGLTSMRWTSYALATAVGILPGTAVYTYFADALLQGSQEASREAYIRVLVAGLLLVLLSLVPTLIKKLKIRLPGAAGAALLLMGIHLGTLEAQVARHAPLTSTLQGVVQAPKVDYAALKAGRGALDAYLAEMARANATELESASENERLAFWINAYNACMLKRVVDHYPITKAGSFFSRIKNRLADRPANSVWQIEDVFTGPHCEIAGASRSQDEIEHSIIRPIGDPRIHFVVNCAARSCPSLLPEAFEAETLDAQLDRAVRDFIADPRHFALEAGDTPTLRLNKVLEWYGDDFGGTDALPDFFAPYVEAEQASLLASPDLRVEFFEYDWTLNDTTS